MKLKSNVYIALGLTAILGLGLTGCGSVKAENTAPPATTIQISEEALENIEATSVFADITEEVITTTIAVNTEDVDFVDSAAETEADSKVVSAAETEVDSKVDEVAPDTEAEVTETENASMYDEIVKQSYDALVSACQKNENITVLGTGIMTIGDTQLVYVINRAPNVDANVAYVNMFATGNPDPAVSLIASLPLGLNITTENCQEAVKQIKGYTTEDGLLLYSECAVDEAGTVKFALYSTENGIVARGSRVDELNYLNVNYTYPTQKYGIDSSDSSVFDISHLTEIECVFDFNI